MQAQDFCNLFADFKNRVQGGHRLLKNHRNIVASDAPHFIVRQSQQVVVVEGDLSTNNATRFREELQQGERSHRFSAPRFADQSQGFPRANGKRNIVNGFDNSVAGEKVTLEVVDGQSGFHKGSLLIVHVYTLVPLGSRVQADLDGFFLRKGWCPVAEYEDNSIMELTYVDLHIHSTCSDGYYTPEDLVRMAADAGLVAVALADHDNIDGIERAILAGREYDVEVFAAVELSTQWHEYSDMHLLGYGFDYRDPYLIRALTEFQTYRRQRNFQIIERVNDKLRGERRQPLDAHEVQKLADGTIGRPHIALALRQAGYVSNNDEAFERYLVPCNVPKHYFPVDEAINLIHAGGGIAVLAHPPYITRDRRKLERLTAELVAMGLDGVEAYNNGSGLEETDWLIRLAGQHDLIVTGGSDFHGDPGSAVEIGRGIRGIRVPYSCAQAIKTALLRRRS